MSSSCPAMKGRLQSWAKQSPLLMKRVMKMVCILAKHSSIILPRFDETNTTKTTMTDQKPRPTVLHVPTMIALVAWQTATLGIGNDPYEPIQLTG